MFTRSPVLLLLALVPTFCQAPGRQPFAKALECPGGDCPFLNGTPQTAGMRSGFVRLKPSATVGWHTTGKHEEALIILRGQGAVLIDSQAKRTFTGPAVAYIPPETRHNVENTGTEALEYVYVVSPVAAQ